ncbi:hypothetical protein [Haloarcula sp. CGMCC 1.2071]|uniref:hypothetical protein n=1 Tax=Haloarcula sp. CGMCC 1.2071 TaxID=3111454 RepID=UPI00300F6089
MPTTYRKNWDPEIVNKYITQESQQKSREEFEKTHVPINRIRVEENKVFDTWTDEDESLVSEDIVLETVSRSIKDDTNRLFFVVGESGSGKSELCQWLDYQIQDESDRADEGEFAHEPILIPRHVREPREVVELLTENLDGWDFEDAKYLRNLPMEGIYREVTGKILNRFKGSQQSTVDFLKDDAFESKVRSNLEAYVDAFDDPDASISFEPIEQDELATLLEKFPGVAREHEHHEVDPAEYLYREIKTGATEAVSDMLSAGDIQQILRDIDKAYRSRNRRPVLIIEDLTGFTVYDHQVLSFFSDLGTAHFDVVIGVTTGVHQSLIDQRRADMSSQDTIDDRIQARLKLTEAAEDGSGSETLFLKQEDIHIDLVRNYLKAIKKDSDRVYDPSLPDGLASDDIDAAFGDWLYPFNRGFLDRIYHNLQEENVTKQTPRIYLNFVISELLDNQNPPFEHAEKLKQRLGNIENRIDPEYNGSDEQVLKWYGTDEGEQYTVDEDVPQMFDIESDGRAPTIGGFEEICPECNAGVNVSGRKWTCPECGHEYDETKDGPPRSEIFTEQRNELLAWVRGESDFDQTSNIEDGAKRVITYFFDKPNSLRIPACRSSDAAYLRWEKGSSRVPVHVRNADRPSYTQVELTRDTDQSVLLALLRIGVWEDADLERLERRGNINLDRLRRWATETVRDLREDLETDISETYGVTLDEVALFGKYVLNVFGGNGTEFTPEALTEPVSEQDISQVYSRTAFDGNINALKNNVGVYKGLFHARFHLRRNVVDYDRLEKAMTSLTPEDLMLKISSIEGEISSFKIGETSRESIELDAFLKSKSYNIRGLARDIDEYDAIFTDDLSMTRTQFTELATAVEGIDIPLDVSRLKDAYDPLGRPDPSILDDITRLDEEKLDAFLEDLGLVVDRVTACDDVWDFLAVQRFAGEIKYGQWTEPYTTLSNFVDELETLEQDLDSRIHELEKETFEPDKTPYEEVQTESQELISKFGGGL